MDIGTRWWDFCSGGVAEVTDRWSRTVGHRWGWVGMDGWWGYAGGSTPTCPHTTVEYEIAPCVQEKHRGTAGDDDDEERMTMMMMTMTMMTMIKKNQAKQPGGVGQMMCDGYRAESVSEEI